MAAYLHSWDSRNKKATCVKCGTRRERNGAYEVVYVTPYGETFSGSPSCEEVIKVAQVRQGMEEIAAIARSKNIVVISLSELARMARDRASREKYNAPMKTGG